MDVRKRRKDKKAKTNINININLKAIAVIALAVIILVSIILLTRNIILKKRKNVENPAQQEINVLFEEINKEGEEFLKPEDTVITISVVGGIFCDDGILNSAYNKETEEYSFYNSFNKITNRTLNADIAIGTLNTNFVDKKSYTSKNTHNAPEELASALKLIGIDILNIATNCSYDYGLEGIRSTKSTLEENGINGIGTYEEESEAGAILIKEIEDVKIAFLSYTYKTDKNISKNNAYSVNIIDKEKIKEDIEKSKKTGADFVFINMNWGEEKSNNITSEQRELADFLVENGADFIIGSHPILVQPMEMKKNSDGKDVLIAYSLGNFLSSGNYKESNIGLTLNIQITKSAETGEKYLSKVIYTPIYIVDNGKNSANRYEILDIREEIQKYQENSKEKVSEDLYVELKQALNKVEELIGGNG